MLLTQEVFPVQEYDLVDGRGGKGVNDGLSAKLPYKESVWLDLV